MRPGELSTSVPVPALDATRRWLLAQSALLALGALVLYWTFEATDLDRLLAQSLFDPELGIFPLRRFFSGGTRSDDGEEMSWDAVKEKLKRIVEHEDKHHPLNDDQIVEHLAAEGIELARRTVAKYREQLGLPPAHKRK